MNRRETGHGYRAALLVLVGAGFALRLPLLATFPFREDEAIYAFWARHGWQVDPLFLQVWPDKPPVFIWLLGLIFQGWEATPPAARLLNIIVSTLTIPVVAATARRWWGDVAGGAAGALAALSPFAVSFAPTAFTDPLLLLTGALALCLVARRRWFWSGLWLGLAIMTKQQGLLFMPLLLAAPLTMPGHRLTHGRRGATHPLIHRSPFRRRLPPPVLRFMLGLLAILLPILLWDSLRWTVAPSPWDLGARNVGSVTLAPPADWGLRLWAWGGLAWYLMASWAAWAALAAVVAVALWQRLGETPHVLTLWALFFFGVHVVTSVQLWDRYLLPLVLPLALIGGWATATVAQMAAPHLPDGRARAGAALAAVGLAGVLLAAPAMEAARGEYPIGGDHGAYAGLDEALAYVRAASEAGPVVLYHRELGWHARFYLFDPIQTGAVEVRYFPHAVYLADSATKSPHERRLVIVPDWAPIRDLPWQGRNRGLAAPVRLRSGNFTVLELEPIATGDAGWRICRAQVGAPAPWTALTGARAEDMMCRQ